MSDSKNEQKKKESTLSNEILSGVLQSPFYPVSYVKILMQIGHEPLPPTSSRGFFGNKILYYYPNAFQYSRYIYSVEGITGLYRGLGMKIISQSVGNFVYDRTFRLLESDENEKHNKSQLEEFCKQTTREVASRCWGVVFSHPFHVMALRCMAQFVGGETRYSSWNVLQNTIEIYNSEGILGFFSGLIPRLLFEASTIALTNGIAYLIKTYIFEDKEIDALIDLLSSLLASSVTYPLSVVSTVSTISGSALIAGRPPRMLVYASWLDCFKHLYENDELKRGSKTFFRTYKEPLSIRGQNEFVLNVHPTGASSKRLLNRDI